MLQLFFCGVILFNYSNLFAKNSFFVAPTRVEFNMNSSKISSFIVSNNGSERIRIRVRPIYYNPNAKVMNIGKNLPSNQDGKDSLVPYIRISPQTFSLMPGMRRTLRTAISPNKDLPDGEYRAHLIVSMLEVATQMRSNEEKKDGIGMNLSFKMESAVAIYGSKGEGTFNLELEKCIRDGKKLKILITNKGKWRFDGWLHIKDDNKYSEKKKLFLLRETKRLFPVGDISSKINKLHLSWSDMNGKEIKTVSCVITKKIKSDINLKIVEP